MGSVGVGTVVLIVYAIGVLVRGVTFASAMLAMIRDDFQGVEKELKDLRKRDPSMHHKLSPDGDDHIDDFRAAAREDPGGLSAIAVVMVVLMSLLWPLWAINVAWSTLRSKLRPRKLGSGDETNTTDTSTRGD